MSFFHKLLYNTIMNINNNLSSKICAKCHQEKNINEFVSRIDSADGYRNQCKICFYQRIKKYYCRHKKARKKYYKEYYFKHREKSRIESKKWRLLHKEKIKLATKEYYLKNKNKILFKSKQYRRKNKHKLCIQNRIYQNNKLKTDINYKIYRLYRGRIYQALKNNWKSGRTINLIMCSIPELKLHIEKQWLAGMTWKNWGRGVGKWNIDHIIPCSFFNMSDPVEQYMCFRWKNLQPLWWEDNRIKSDNIIKC